MDDADKTTDKTTYKTTYVRTRDIAHERDVRLTKALERLLQRCGSESIIQELVWLFLRMRDESPKHWRLMCSNVDQLFPSEEDEG